MEIPETIFDKPYWLIDILPEQVPEERAAAYFAAERYWLRPENLEGIRRRFADLLLKLNCYHSLEAAAGEDASAPAGAPEQLAARVTEAREDLVFYLPGSDAAVTLNRDDLYMTVYNPPKPLLELLDRLAPACGLFLRGTGPAAGNQAAL